MDFLQLKYFKTVAKLENITRAAEELHIAQPSLSKVISRLEDSVGVPLFDRIGRRIRINEFGRIFLNRVDRIFLELDEGKKEVSDLAKLKFRSITVGATSSRLLPTLIKKYLTKNPNTNFRLLQITRQKEIKKVLLMEILTLQYLFCQLIKGSLIV